MPRPRTIDAVRQSPTFQMLFSENWGHLKSEVDKAHRSTVEQLDQMNMPLLDPNAVQSDENWYAKQGAVKQPVPVEKVVNPEFVQAALQQLVAN